MGANAPKYLKVHDGRKFTLVLVRVAKSRNSSKIERIMFKSSLRGASLPLLAVGVGLMALAGCGGGGNNLPTPGSGDGTLGNNGNSGGNGNNGGGNGGSQVDASTIVFVSTRDGNPEIYSIKSDGTGARRLTNNAATDEQPSRSIDGRTIVFSSRRDGNSEIYKMNADGSGVVRLTLDAPADDAPIDTNPVFSPDGSKIVWQSTRAITFGGAVPRRLFIMDASGANQRPVVLPEENRSSFDGSWNPDNSRLIGLVNSTTVAGANDLAVISPGNGTATPATASVLRATTSLSHPRYSPAGARIVASNAPVGGAGRLQLLNADGTPIGDGPSGGVGQNAPSFNPAGTRIAWDAAPAAGQGRQLYVGNVVAGATQPAGTAITTSAQGENYDASWTQ